MPHSPRSCPHLDGNGAPSRTKPTAERMGKNKRYVAAFTLVQALCDAVRCEHIARCEPDDARWRKTTQAVDVARAELMAFVMREK